MLENALFTEFKLPDFSSPQVVPFYSKQIDEFFLQKNNLIVKKKCLITLDTKPEDLSRIKWNVRCKASKPIVPYQILKMLVA